MRTTCRVLLVSAITAGCAGTDRPSPTPNSATATLATSDCLGPGTPQINVGQVGQLHLNTSLRELARLCPEIRDSIAHGDESIDTAIVISRPGLTVVGRLANIANDEGSKPFRVDSAAIITYWTIFGIEGTLPKGVPLSASWDSLVAAFGEPIIVPLNGDIHVSFCKTLPEFVFHFDDRLYQERPDLVSRETYPSSLKGARIREVDLPSRRIARPFCQG